MIARTLIFQMYARRIEFLQKEIDFANARLTDISNSIDKVVEKIALLNSAEDNAAKITFYNQRIGNLENERDKVTQEKKQLVAELDVCLTKQEEGAAPECAAPASTLLVDPLLSKKQEINGTVGHIAICVCILAR